MRFTTRQARISVAAGDAVPVTERFRVSQWLRVAFAGLLGMGLLTLPSAFEPQGNEMVPWLLGYLGVAGLGEVAVRLRPQRALGLFSTFLILDGIWLSTLTYLSGATTSPVRYGVLLHLGAVTLLASYRTGVKLAVWHSLLLLASRNLVDARVLPDTTQSDLIGSASQDQRLIIFVVVLWLVAISTSTLSAINERELRRRRGDLEALTHLAEQIERTDDSSSVARTLLDAAVASFGFPRGIVLASADGHLPLLASYGLDDTVARRPGRAGPSEVVQEAHAQKATVLVQGLDPEADPWLSRLLPDARNLVVVPLSAEGRSLGALVVEAPKDVRIQRRVVTGLERSATYAALALRNAWLLEQVQRLAATDGLTKIANRRTFETTLEREIARATRSAEHLSLVMIDIDHFKALNDNHGHQAGDEVLRNVAAALSCECRDFDTAARYGGEEFAVILPGCGPEEALEIAERLRSSVALVPGTVQVTASAGVATFPAHAGDVDTLVRAADQALYASKAAGRNRTSTSAGVSPEAQVDALVRRAVSQRLGRPPEDESGPHAPAPRSRDT